MVNRGRFLVLLGILLAVAGATGAVIFTHPVGANVPATPPGMQIFRHWKYRVTALMREGRFVEAEQLALRIRHAFPGQAFSDRLLGRIYYETGRFDEAAAIFRVLLLRSGGADAVARNNLGMTLLRLQRYEQSLRELRIAAAMMPNESYVRYNLEEVAKLAGIRGSRLPLPELTPEGRREVPVEVIVADFMPANGENGEKGAK